MFLIFFFNVGLFWAQTFSIQTFLILHNFPFLLYCRLFPVEIISYPSLEPQLCLDVEHGWINKFEDP